jgi:two-component system sensor histidine kinase PilS (NtrC family)
VRIYQKPLAGAALFGPQWLSTIGVDVLVFSSLQFLQSGSINYTPLFALPVLFASVLGS